MLSGALKSPMALNTNKFNFGQGAPPLQISNMNKKGPDSQDNIKSPYLNLGAPPTLAQKMGLTESRKSP